MTSMNSQTGAIAATQDAASENMLSGQTPEAKAARAGLIARWGAKFGMAAFMFFLIKGLLWLVVPAGIAAVAFLRG